MVVRGQEPYKANIIPLSWTNLMPRTSKQTLINSLLSQCFFAIQPDVQQIFKKVKGQAKLLQTLFFHVYNTFFYSHTVKLFFSVNILHPS